MIDEPTNAAAEFTRYAIGMLNDEDWVRTNGLSLVTPDFVRFDRRRITPQPPADRDAWLAATIAWAEVSGAWPRYSIPAVVAVRGERLVLYRLLVSLENGSEAQYMVVSQVDAAVECGELTIFFDPEDVDLAIAELDRLNAGLESRHRPTS